MAIAVRGVIVDKRRLDELAHEIREGHADIKQTLERTLVRAIGVGKSLQEAKSILIRGEFGPWVEEDCGLVYSTATAYMRLAHYQAILPSGMNVSEAVSYLRGLPPADGRIPSMPYPDEIRNEARRRKKLGHSATQIGKDMGIPTTTISKWCDGSNKHKERARRAMAKRNLLRAEKREALRAQAAREAKTRGGSLGEAYSLLRRLAQELDRASAQYQSGDPIRKSLRAALSDIHTAERHISVALGVDYGSWRKVEEERISGRLKGDLEKPCEDCGTTFKYRSSKAQFCPDCIRRRGKESARQRYQQTKARDENRK
jgi:hypothetical protein